LKILLTSSDRSPSAKGQLPAILMQASSAMASTGRSSSQISNYKLKIA
jgi:hypothetical protein